MFLHQMVAYLPTFQTHSTKINTFGPSRFPNALYLKCSIFCTKEIKQSTRPRNIYKKILVLFVFFSCEIFFYFSFSSFFLLYISSLFHLLLFLFFFSNSFTTSPFSLLLVIFFFFSTNLFFSFFSSFSSSSSSSSSKNKI